MSGYFFVQSFLIERRAQRVAEVVLDFLVYWDGKVVGEVSLEDGFAGVAREVVLDAMSAQHPELQRVGGESLVDVLGLLGERLVFLGELSPVVAVHDDDCLSAPVKPAFWFVLAEEVCPSPNEIEGVGDFVLCKFIEQFSEDGPVG